MNQDQEGERRERNHFVSFDQGTFCVFQVIQAQSVKGLQDTSWKGEQGIPRGTDIHTDIPLSKDVAHSPSIPYDPLLTPKQLSLRLDLLLSTPIYTFTTNTTSQYRHLLTLFTFSYYTREDSIILSSFTPCDTSRHPHRTLHLSHRAPWEES